MLPIQVKSAFIFTAIEKKDLQMHTFYSLLPWISLRKYLAVLDQKLHITRYPCHLLLIIACLLKIHIHRVTKVD